MTAGEIVLLLLCPLELAGMKLEAKRRASPRPRPKASTRGELRQLKPKPRKSAD
jgi:hypothetical protein